MSSAVRKLAPGEVVIGFITLEGKLLGELADPDIGHEELSYRIQSLRSKLAGGQAMGITIGKPGSGEIKVFGSGYFPPPGGSPLTAELRERVRELVE